MTTTKTLLAVDGNSLLHRSFHALLGSNLRTVDGRPTWAVKGFMSQLIGAVERTGADAVVVGFDDHTLNTRKVDYPHYKATRSPKPPELGQQIQLVIELLRAAGVRVVVPPGLEADDVLASAGAFAPTVGWRTVIVTSDRDSFALIDEHTSVLRVIKGGIEASPILTPGRLHSMISVPPEQYQQYAAMRGDSSDNLAGIRGVGEVTAAKILTEFGSVQAAFDDVDGGGARVAATIGKAAVSKLANPESRAAFALNLTIMAMHTDLDLGLDLIEPGAGLLPLETDKVLGALGAFELNSLRNYAVKALCSTGNQEYVPQPPAGFDDVPLPFDDAPPPFEDGFSMEELFPAEAYVPATPPPAPAPARRPTSGPVMRGSTAPRPTTWDDSL